MAMSTPPKKRNRQEDRADAALLLDRPLPYDLEAEQGVLGAMLLMPEVCDDVALAVRPSDFYDDAHRKLFEHMLEIHASGRAIDPVLVLDRLKGTPELEALGGPAYLVELGKAVPRLANAMHYARIVRAKAQVRHLIQAAAETLQEAFESGHDTEGLLSRAESRIFGILDDKQTANVQPVKDVMHAAMERLDARMRGEHTMGGVETGFRGYDDMTGGLHNGELVVLAARPSMGKTALALNIAENSALKYRVPTLVVSLEMSAIELGDRLLWSVARVNSKGLRTGHLSTEKKHKLLEAASLLSEAPLFIDDSPSRTVTEIAAAARRIRRKEKDGLGLIVIDYLQLIEPDNSADPRQEQVAKITRRLKGLARELQVPLLVLAQLNRQADNAKETPRLSQLRESGAIEQDADVVLFVHRDDYGVTSGDGQEENPDEPNAKIIIAKQRNGPTGEVKVQWMKEYTRFENAEFRQPNPDLVLPAAGEYS